MARPAAKLGEFVVCFGACSPGFIIIVLQFKTFINSRPAARVGDLCSNCCFGPPPANCWCPRRIITGSFRTFIANRPAATLGSIVSRGIIVTGSFNTFIGG